MPKHVVTLRAVAEAANMHPGSATPQAPAADGSRFDAQGRYVEAVGAP